MLVPSSVLAATQYEYIEYHKMAEGKGALGDLDPINPKSEFYTDEEKAVLVFAFNRLDGYVDLAFDLYQDGTYVTTYDSWADGDGRRFVYDFNINFVDLPVSDASGAWELDTYIDGEYAFSDEFYVFPSFIYNGDGLTKYDYIDYHVIAEDTYDYYPYDPINPKSLFYTDEKQATMAIAFNRLDGRVDFEFDLYQDGNFITTYTGWAEGDGRDWFYKFTIPFSDLPVYSVEGAWQIDTYIDGVYEFTDEFKVVDPYTTTYNGYDNPDEPFVAMVFAALMFYLFFIIPYIAIQVILKKRLKVKTMMVGGTLVFLFFLIAVGSSDSDMSGTEAVYLIIGAVITLLILRFFGAMYPGKEKEEPEKAPAPPKPTPVEKEKTPEPKKEIKKEPPKISGPTKRCPYCKGKLSELNFYKLKSGNDVTCEYCGEIISG